jgi:5-formyltetrahydrofolate cyclo-ligase
MAYMSFRNEVSTDAIIAQAIETGKRVAVPVVDREQRQLFPSELINFPADLKKGTWGIREPKQSCLRPLDPCLIDLVLVPGVVFDQAGNRLGYGFGFYDRFLVSLRSGVRRVALAYSFQLVEKLPAEEHDCPVDLIVTEKKLIACLASKREKPNFEV